MRLYTVHRRPLIADPDADIVFVKEGFNWYAFLFTLVWALWNRMWWVALGLVGVQAALNVAIWLTGLNEFGQTVISLGVAILFGTLANDLYRWTLERKGFDVSSVVVGPNADEAMVRFFDHNPDLAAGRF